MVCVFSYRDFRKENSGLGLLELLIAFSIVLPRELEFIPENRAAATLSP
jgi:hypothetical protein